jgi:hypothetical protein
MMVDRCVCCGEIIPEGGMVCPNCLVGREHIKTNYERIISMSMKELAESICDNTNECGDCVGFCYCVADAGHANGLIEWLENESEEESHG